MASMVLLVIIMATYSRWIEKPHWSTNSIHRDPGMVLHTVPPLSQDQFYFCLGTCSTSIVLSHYHIPDSVPSVLP